jgi:hypothetical protein
LGFALHPSEAWESERGKQRERHEILHFTGKKGIALSDVSADRASDKGDTSVETLEWLQVVARVKGQEF